MEIHGFQIITSFLQFSPKVGRFVRGKPSAAEILSLAEQIYAAYLANLSFRQAVHTFMDLCYTIDDAKKKAIGKNGSIFVSNALHQVLSMLLAMRTSPSSAELGWLSRTKSEFAAADKGLENWIAPKLQVLETAVMSVDASRQFAEEVTIVNPEAQLEVVGQALPSLGNDITAMMEELRMLRRYGVKTSFFKDQHIQSPGNAWVFWDPRDTREALDLPVEFHSHLVHLALAVEKDLADIRLLKDRIATGQYAVLRGVKFSFEGYFAWSMDQQAELNLLVGLFGGASVREIFRSQGKEVHYELMRMILALRLYDLIVPLETVRSLPSPESGAGRLQKLFDFARRERVRTRIRDLLVPRLRTLEDMPQLVEQLEREVEAADEETSRRAAQRRHDVIDHIRKLPEGHRPSLKARRLALEEIGVELAENETYVKKHQRGKGEPLTLPHRQRQRKG